MLQFFASYKEFLATFGLFAGGIFALWRWVIDQRWRRAQHAQTLIKEFLAKENTKKACEVIDTDRYVVSFEASDGKKTSIRITNEFLIGALSTFDQKDENTDKELIVRNICDEFFDDLGIFQSHIDTKLIRLTDIGPYLEYWVRELSGHGNIRSKEFAEQAAKFLRYFGYDRLLTLARNMNSEFPN